MRWLPLICLLVPVLRAEITFTVEEPPYRTHSHHHHRHRHSRDSKPHPSPYRAAASSLSSTNPAIVEPPEHFSLNCPHVADASNPDVKIEVTWTLDDTVWLKIRNGEKKIVNQLTSFNKRLIADKAVMRVTLNNRYFFTYDELTGDFGMEITPVVPQDDVGMWQCHVTVQHRSETSTLTSRSRVKGPPGGVVASPRPSVDGQQQRAVVDKASTALYRIPPMPQYPGSPPLNAKYYPPARIEYDDEQQQQQQQQKISSFQRPNKHSVQISRDNNKRRQTVVFDRSVTKEYPRLASIDYELSMADEDPDADPSASQPHRDRGVRTRAALQGGGAASGQLPYLTVLLATLVPALLW